jgi:hypothetical protein
MERREMIAKTNASAASTQAGSSHSFNEARTMTTAAASGERFSVELEADEQGVLWLVDAERTRYQLAVVLHAGWRIVDATPAERAVLEAHGFGRGWVQ